MSNRITDHLSPSDLSFLRAINYVPPDLLEPEPNKNQTLWDLMRELIFKEKPETPDGSIQS